MNHSSQTQSQDDFTFFRQKPDGDMDPAGEAGWYLQRERERSGFNLEQAGEACGIHPHHLEGIELGDLTQLPPRTEALQMVGAYARFLQLDPQPLVLHYAQFLPQPMPMAKRGKPRRPHPLSSAKIISFANIDKLKSVTSGAGGIVASVLAAIIVFQGMVFVLSPDSPTQQPVVAAPQMSAEVDTSTPSAQPSGGEIVASISRISESTLDDAVDQRINQLANEADQSAGGLSGLTELIEQGAANVKIPLPKIKPAMSDQLAGQPLQPSAPTTRAVVSTTSGSGKVYGSKNAGARLILTARATVWIRIEDRQGNVVMTQTLHKGDTYRVPNRQGLIVIARDGGLIGYSVDGIDKGPLGDHGEILVGRPLDLASLANRQG